MAGKAQNKVPLSGAEPEGAKAELSATAALGGEELIILENSAYGIYEAILGGEIIAGVIYSKAGNRVTLRATSVFPAFRGMGIPAKLLSSIFALLRAQGATVIVTCPFAAEFVSARPEYEDVLDLTILREQPGTGADLMPVGRSTHLKTVCMTHVSSRGIL